MSSFLAKADDCTEESSFIELSETCIEKNSVKLDKARERVAIQRKNLEKLIKNKAKDRAIKAAEFGLNGVINLKGKIEDVSEEVLGTTYFFKTSTGLLGKFVVRAVTINVEECSVFLESRTYSPKGEVDSSINFVIKNEANSWNVDNGSFDSSGRSDFVLKREHGYCVFKNVDGIAFKFGKTNESNKIEGNRLLENAAYFLIFLSVFLIMRTVFADEDRFKAESRLEDADDDGKKQTPNDFVLKISSPFFKRYFSPVVAGMKSKKKIKEKYKRPLAASGMNVYLTPEDFYAFKLFLIVGFPIAYAIGGKFLEVEVELNYIPILMFVGFFYPNLWVSDKAKVRRANILMNMPFIVDMLALSVEAGLDFAAAIQRVIEKAPHSALVEEFEIFLKEIRVGSSRAEALRNMSWRIDSLPISSFCATLIAADSVGTSNLAPILKTLSSEIRQKRSSEIEKKGAQASTKILFPMLFLILPAVICIIAAPFVISFMGGG